METTKSRPAKLLYDTTVYIDILQNRFPKQGDLMLRAVDAWHCPITESELSAACGLLDPGHPQTRKVFDEIAAIIDRRPLQRIVIPDREIWCEAGILSGLIARLQGYQKDQRRRALNDALNDALLYATARRHGCTVLTRNLADFDLLQQLDPSGRVLFYKI